MRQTVKTMDTRNKNGLCRADGSGSFSPRTSATPDCPSFKIAKAHAACTFAISLISPLRPNALIALIALLSIPFSLIAPTLLIALIALLSLPLSALADDAGTTQTIILDVASKGSLGALITAAAFWLNSRSKAKATESALPLTPPPAERNPPLGEDVARTYVTKADMQECRGVCRKDIDDLRAKIDANDHAAEQRSVSTHRRIDQVFVSQQKTNKALGMMVGIMVGKGVAPASMATMTIAEEG
jgi:hypothetical protein